MQLTMPKVTVPVRRQNAVPRSQAERLWLIGGAMGWGVGALFARRSEEGARGDSRPLRQLHRGELPFGATHWVTTRSSRWTTQSRSR